jgi:undecaprenyl-diphosphatase
MEDARQMRARWKKAGGIFAMIRMIAAGDRRLMTRVNRWRPPRWLRTWMTAASRAGDGWLWIGLGALIALFGGPLRIEAILTGLASAGLGWAVFFFVKKLAGRERPCASQPNCWATLLPPDRFSFPSGHTIMAFAITASIGLYYPSLLAGLIFCAMSVAASRVLLGLHYLTDVLAGIALGCLIGMSMTVAVPRLLTAILNV